MRSSDSLLVNSDCPGKEERGEGRDKGQCEQCPCAAPRPMCAESERKEGTDTGAGGRRGEECTQEMRPEPEGIIPTTAAQLCQPGPKETRGRKAAGREGSHGKEGWGHRHGTPISAAHRHSLAPTRMEVE